MSAIAPLLLAASAVICLLIGLLHLLMTFHGPKLFPRDDDLRRRMQETSLVITSETTMWKTWIGFNASHSYSLILFGAIYGYLALTHGDLLFRSTFLLSLGLLVLHGYIVLAKKYFFSIPLRLILLATSLYGLALIVSWARA